MNAVQEIDFKQASISQLESNAEKAWHKFEQSWLEFTASLVALKKGLGYNDEEWDVYRKSKPYGVWAGSTLRHYTKIADVALAVQQELQEEMDKREARKLKDSLSKVIPKNDSDLTGDVWKLAYRNTGEIYPSKQAIQCAYEVVKEVSVTGAFTYEGESVKASDVLMNDMFQASLIEKIKTQKQYIADHAKPTNKLTIEANSKLVDALIEASNGVLGYEMLGKQVTIVWKDSKDE